MMDGKKTSLRRTKALHAFLLIGAWMAWGGGVMAGETAQQALVIPNSGFENNGEGWRAETGAAKNDAGGPNAVVWERTDGRTCARLVFSGAKWLWLNTPPLADLEPKKEVRLAFRAKWLSGGSVFCVGCNSFKRADDNWGDVYDGLWVGELPKESQWHEIEIAFVTPAFDFKERYLRIKMGPRDEACAMLIGDVRIVSIGEPAPAPAEPTDSSRVGEAQLDIPDDLSPADFPGVSAETQDGRTWRRVSAGDVLVRAAAEIEPRLGFHEAVPISLENKGDREARVEIAPVGRLNVYAEGATVEVPGGGRREVSLPFQTLRIVDFDVALKVRSSGVERQLPVRVRPRTMYPIFGLVEHFHRCPPRTDWGNYADPKVSLKAEEDMAYMRLLPCQIFRVDGPGCWPSVEGKKGVYSFASADWCIPATRKFGGAKSLMLLGYDPGWAQPLLNPAETEKLDHWRDYVRAVVRRYRDQVDYWEVWNEPYGFWFGGWGNERKKLFQKDYAEECGPILGAVIRVASEVIRQEDPDGKILTPGFVPPAKEAGSEPYCMMDKLFQMGMGDWVDFINLHIYPGFDPLPLTGLRYELDGKEVESWPTALKQWRRFDKQITTQDLLDLMAKHGVRKPLWITEFGGHSAAGERFQGLGILRQAAVLVSEGAEALHYYEFYDYPHEPSRMQLIRNEDKRRTLGFIAYSQAIRYLTGARPEPGRCEAARTDGPDVGDLSYRVFGRGDETILCVWSNAATPADVAVRMGSPVGTARVIRFAPQGAFVTETELSLKGNTAGDGARLASDREFRVRLAPLEFRMCSFRP